MTVAEKIEIVLIPVFGIIFWLLAAQLPEEVDFGILLLGASALLLLQSLIRDLWILSKEKMKRQSKAPRRARCMCLESTVGTIGVVLGSVVLVAGVKYSVPMNSWSWSFLGMGLMIMSFIIKNYVLEWNSFRILRDKDHMNIIFTWKK